MFAKSRRETPKQSWLKLVWVSFILIILMSCAYSDFPTSAGVSINTGIITINAGNTLISTADFSTQLIVHPIYGIELIPSLGREVTTNTFDPIYFNHQIINKANTTDSLVITINAVGSAWQSRFIGDDNNDGIHQSSENILISSPLILSGQTSQNVFLELTPLMLGSVSNDMIVSTNAISHGDYTGFNGFIYGGAGKLKVSDNVLVLSDNIPPQIVPVSPTAGAQNVAPEEDIVLDIYYTASGVPTESIDILINGEAAVISGSFTVDYNGVNSRFIPTANGYRVVVDKILLLPQSATISVTINARDIEFDQAIATYSFTTTVAVSFIRIQFRSLLQGYYQPSADTQLTTSVNIEFRTTRNVAAGVSFNINLRPDGWSNILDIAGVAPGNYYLFIGQLNHVSVVTTESISFQASGTTVNISETGSPYFRSIYLSGKAKNATAAMRTEANGMLTIRGGDYNRDNTLNIVDWASFDYEWKTSGTIADFDGNGIIDTRDYGIWLSNNQMYLPLD